MSKIKVRRDGRNSFVNRCGRKLRERGAQALVYLLHHHQQDLFPDMRHVQPTANNVHFTIRFGGYIIHASFEPTGSILGKGNGFLCVTRATKNGATVSSLLGKHYIERPLNKFRKLRRRSTKFVAVKRKKR